MKLINLITSAVLWVSQVHSASTEGTIDPFECLPGRPVIITTDNIASQCMEKFLRFVTNQLIKKSITLEHSLDLFEIKTEANQASETRIFLMEYFLEIFPEYLAMLPGSDTTSEMLLGRSRFAFSSECDIPALLVKAMSDHVRSSILGPNDYFKVCNHFLCKPYHGSYEPAHSDFYRFSKTEIKDGIIYQDEEALTTTKTLWALSLSGELCIFPEKKRHILSSHHHSFFFQRDGIGLAVACAGNMEVRAGKITCIDRGSGHYAPTTLQLMLAISYFDSVKCISEDIIFNNGPHSIRHVSLAHLLCFADIFKLLIQQS